MTDRVYVIDDDADVRQSVEWVLRLVGYEVRTFASADAFLDLDVTPDPCCLIVDLLLPSMTGLKVCREVEARRSSCAFLMITGYGDVPSAVEAMKLGAVDFLEKPFSQQRLLDAVSLAIAQARENHRRQSSESQYAARLAQLTCRERQVLDAVAAGLVTKEVARRLGISSRTVDVHRSRIMQKLGIESPLQLAKILAILGSPAGRSVTSRTA